ncbi:MAG TPA: hypothetical protein VMH24_02500 [Candidatus Sulfotelmatobacter sp.]|nr:hypothetical protein [Candidatus Sulfotelmatobacter sp.]
MRKQAAWLAVASVGGVIGVIGWANQPITVILAVCSGMPDDAAPTCPPQLSPIVQTPDAANVWVWALGGIVLAVGLAAVGWALVGLVAGHRRPT